MSKLDNFFRDKLNQREFEFDDAYWEAAEKLIDQDRRRRRFGAWWFWGGLLVLLLGGLYWWLPNSTNSVSTPNSSLSTTLPSNLENTDDNLTFDPTQNNDENKSTTAAANNAQPIEPSGSSIAESDDTAQNLVTTKGTTTTKGFSQKRSSDQGETKTAINESDAPIADEQTETLTELADEDESPPETSASGGANDDNPARLALDRMRLREVPIIPLLSEEPMEDLVPEAEEIIILSDNRPKLHYGLRAYSHFYPAQARQQWWRGAAFGLTASYDLNNDWAVGADLLYTYQTGTFNVLKESEQINYSFGARVEQFNLTPTALHGLELPVYLIHKVKSHRLQAGFNLGYFIAMRAHVDVRNSLYPWERETEAEIQTRFSALRREDTIWADQLDPVRRLQLALQLGYQYRIRPWLGLDFRTQLQLTNWKTSPENTELLNLPLRRENQPITFQLGLSWYLR